MSKKRSNSDSSIVFSSGRQTDEHYGGNAPKARKKSGKRKGAVNGTVWVILITLSVILLVAYFIIISIHPVGLVEYVNSLYLSFGSGQGYNVDIEDGTPEYTVSANGKYFLVTDSSVYLYNTGGKKITERSHSYSSPVVVPGDTRYLLYGQGESELTVATFGDTLFTQSFDRGIICADISKSGGYAVAAKTDGYDSSVAVFDKNNNKVYEWFSTQETINAVALSDNGKKLAVATLRVDSGAFVSSIYVLEFDSADPIMKQTYEDEVVYELKSVDNSGCYAVFESKIEFLDFSKQSVQTHASDYNISIVKSFGNRVIVLRTAAANSEQNVIEIYKDSGELISSFSVSEFVTDLSYRSGKVYILGLSNIYKYNTEGELQASSTVDFDASFIESVSENDVACIRNSSIDKYTLTKVEQP